MRYRAFGFVIDSELELIQVTKDHTEEAPEINIRYAKLSETGLSFNDFYQDSREYRMCPNGVANFRITDGKLIEVEPLSEKELAHIGVYILGTCMGAIMHQRKLFLMHGSCVTDGEHSVLLCGNSGAGKSTLASEFLKHGWKLLTDDVARIDGIDEKKPYVRSSYPSQKLWEDSLKNYKHEKEEIHSLYSRGDELKFGVDVSDMFVEGRRPLSLIVRLVVSDTIESDVQLVEGFGKIEQIRQNTYRNWLITDQQQYFQRVVTLGSIMPMAISVRKRGDACAEHLYQRIVSILNEM